MRSPSHFFKPSQEEAWQAFCKYFKQECSVWPPKFTTGTSRLISKFASQYTHGKGRPVHLQAQAATGCSKHWPQSPIHHYIAAKIAFERAVKVLHRSPQALSSVRSRVGWNYMNWYSVAWLDDDLLGRVVDILTGKSVKEIQSFVSKVKDLSDAKRVCFVDNYVRLDEEDAEDEPVLTLKERVELLEGYVRVLCKRIKALGG